MKKSNAVVSTILLAGVIVGASADGFAPWTDVMKMADTNNDQVLSPTEVMEFQFAQDYPGFQPFIATHFQQLDANGDGMITFEEAHAQMQVLGMQDDAMNKAFTVGTGFMPWDQKS